QRGLQPHPPHLPYTTLFRSHKDARKTANHAGRKGRSPKGWSSLEQQGNRGGERKNRQPAEKAGKEVEKACELKLNHTWLLICHRSEEHTSELQSREDIVCRR